jgi:hypothetical protein
LPAMSFDQSAQLNLSAFRFACNRIQKFSDQLTHGNYVHLP